MKTNTTHRFLITLFALFNLTGAWAQNHKLGLGAVIGDPTGLTGKYLMKRNTSLEATISFFGDKSFYIHGAYIQEKPNFFEIDGEPLGLYYGIGPRIINFRSGYGPYRGLFGTNYTGTSRTSIAARAPLGVNYQFEDPRLEVFGEVALALDVIPFTDADFDLGIGLRYYF